MTGDEFLDLMRQARRSTHVIGNSRNGVIIALDMEGRIFTVLNGRILNRVNPVAILNRSNKKTFFNPGGDTLWPAPEGSCLGYEYSTGEWRVPPSITSACWIVVDQSENNAVIRAEIDLVNNSQVGIPCEFERQINLDYDENQIVLRVIEKIRYLGAITLEKNEFSLAPWSLCQFDSGADSKLVIPTSSESDIWDMYNCSDSKRIIKDNTFIYDSDTDFRFQVGIGKNVPWVEFISGNSLRVKRFVKELPQGQYYIDIADSSPLQYPVETGVKLSIYCDPSGFTEIEACGGSTDRLKTGTELSVEIITIFSTSIIK
jgi:hypothetical protein